MFVLVLKYQTEVKYTLNNYNQSMGPWDSYIYTFTLSMSSIKHPIGKVEACKSQVSMATSAHASSRSENVLSHRQ